MKKLRRDELKTIYGGSTCIAECFGSEGEVSSTVSCTGSTCSSSDGNGCQADGEIKTCPPMQ